MTCIKRIIQFLETRKPWVHRFAMSVFRLDPDNVKALYRRAESRIRQQKRKEPQRYAVFLMFLFGLHGCPFGNRPVKATAYDHDLAIKETLWNKTCFKNPSTQKNFFDVINCHQKYLQEGYQFCVFLVSKRQLFNLAGFSPSKSPGSVEPNCGAPPRKAWMMHFHCHDGPWWTYI